jgi:hypothetical protein
MTADRVHSLLGSTPLMAGGIGGTEDYYPDYGLLVYYSREGKVMDVQLTLSRTPRDPISFDDSWHIIWHTDQPSRFPISP